MVVSWIPIVLSILCCRHVGIEPSGAGYNALELTDCKRPHNPRINTGAMVCASMVHPEVSLSCTIALKDDTICLYRSLWLEGFSTCMMCGQRQQAEKARQLDSRIRIPGRLLEFPACEPGPSDGPSPRAGL